MAYTNKFMFCGTAVLPKEQDKLVSVTDKNGRITKRFSVLIRESESNGMFVELLGSMQKDNNGVIKTLDTENKLIEIPWKERDNADYIAMVASYKKITIDLGEKKEFITEYDAITYLQEILPTVKQPVFVYGSFRKDYYNGKYYPKFVMQSIRFAYDNEEPKLEVNLDLFYNKDSMDDSDFKQTKKVKFMAYTYQYIDKNEKSKYIPHECVLNGTKIDPSNEEHVKIFNYKKSKLKTDKKSYVHIPWKISVYRGAEEVEWDESMLTKTQKEQIEFGLATADQFKPKSAIRGGNVVEYRLLRPLVELEGFSDGAVDTGMKADEFEELIHVPTMAKTESLSEAKEVKASAKADFDDDDLFK